MKYEMNSYVKLPLEYLKIKMLRDKRTKFINLRYVRYKKKQIRSFLTLYLHCGILLCVTVTLYNL